MSSDSLNLWSETMPVLSPQRAIEILGQLQRYAISPIPSAIYIYDLVDQCNISSSCSVADILGYTTAAIHAMEVMEFATLIHPDDLERVSEHFQRFATLLDGEVIQIEYRMKHADGSWHWLRSQETLFIKAIDGFPLQVLGIIQDITAYKAEEKSQGVFSHILENLTEIVGITDQERMVAHIN
jgi:PAS domain S-box-containing protein